MNSIKIFNIIFQLNTFDLNYLKSTFLNSNKSFSKFIEVCILYKNKDQTPTKEIIWKYIFGNSTFDGNKFRKLCHYLFLAIEKELPSLYIRNNNYLQQIEQLNYYALYNINDLFESKFTQTNEFLEKELFFKSSTELYKFRIQNIRYNYLINHPSKSNENNIQTFSNQLDIYYYLKQIQLICHATNEKIFTKQKIQIPLEQDLLNTITKYDYFNHPLIKVYYKMYNLLNDIDYINTYYKIKYEILNESNIDTEEWKTILQYLINYCIYHINKNQQIFEVELFDIYKFYLEKVDEEIISPFKYKNIINLSLKLKDYQFAERFIEDYGKKLPKEQQVTAISFNQAKLNFELGKYNQSIELLNAIRTDDLTFNLSIRTLTIKIFYELNELQFLDTYIDSFRIYILRNKNLTVASKKLYQDFIRIIQKLVRLEYATKKEKESFKMRVYKIANLPDKNWILEKVENL
jgi:hypothetical protein